jgi:hypothetical protein
MKNLAYFLIALFCCSCAPTMDYTWSKNTFNGKAFTKIGVVVVSNDQAVRSTLENKIVTDLKAQGINAIASINSFLPVNAKESDWNTEIIASNLKKYNCDAALGISLVNIQDRTDYVSGETYFYPSGYYRYGRHMYTNYNRVYTPGYYEQNREYVIESNLYDLTVNNIEVNAMVWKGQSSISNPRSVEGGSKTYADNLVGYLIKNSILINPTL